MKRDRTKMLFLVCTLIISISIIGSTLIFVTFNRYELHSNQKESIVFDKFTGNKYNFRALERQP